MQKQKFVMDGGKHSQPHVLIGCGVTMFAKMKDSWMEGVLCLEQY